MSASIAENTLKQYNTALKQWWNFCLNLNLDPYAAQDEMVIKFLTEKYYEGASYGTLNTARSAISLINEEANLAASSSLQRFFKGVYRLRPTTPKYTTTWDTGAVFAKIESWGPTKDLSLQLLTLKTAMLLALGSAFRVQALASMKLSNIKSTGFGVEIRIDEIMKTSKAGAPQPQASFPFFKEKPLLCIATTLSSYINSTKEIRNGEDYLLISYKLPHKKVTSQTISKWIKRVLELAGIEGYSAHSTRHAATSKALNKGLDTETIMKAAGWTEHSTTFARFYNRPIQNHNAFAETILT